jgi:hypothetical protein
VATIGDVMRIIYLLGLIAGIFLASFGAQSIFNAVGISIDLMAASGAGQIINYLIVLICAYLFVTLVWRQSVTGFIVLCSLFSKLAKGAQRFLGLCRIGAQRRLALVHVRIRCGGRALVFGGLRADRHPCAVEIVLHRPRRGHPRDHGRDPLSQLGIQIVAHLDHHLGGVSGNDPVLDHLRSGPSL